VVSGEWHNPDERDPLPDNHAGPAERLCARIHHLIPRDSSRLPLLGIPQAVPDNEPASGGLDKQPFSPKRTRTVWCSKTLVRPASWTDVCRRIQAGNRRRAWPIRHRGGRGRKRAPVHRSRLGSL